MKRESMWSPMLWSLLAMGAITTACDQTNHDIIIEGLEVDCREVKALPEGGSYEIHVLSPKSVVLSRPDNYSFDKTIYNSVTPTAIDAKWYQVQIDGAGNRTIHIEVSENETRQERRGSFQIVSDNYDAEVWVTVIQSSDQ